MSHTDEVTENANHNQMPGDPLAPEPVAPPDYDGHAEGQVSDAGLPDDGSADLEELAVGGLEETRPETATEEVDREGANLPHGGLSPEYDESSSAEDRHDIDRSNDLNTP